MFDPTIHRTNRILTIFFLCQLRRLSEYSVMLSLIWLPPPPPLLTLQPPLQLQCHHLHLHPPPLLSLHLLQLTPFLNVLSPYLRNISSAMPHLMISNS